MTRISGLPAPLCLIPVARLGGPVDGAGLWRARAPWQGKRVTRWNGARVAKRDASPPTGWIRDPAGDILNALAAGPPSLQGDGWIRRSHPGECVLFDRDRDRCWHRGTWPGRPGPRNHGAATASRRPEKNVRDRRIGHVRSGASRTGAA
ncbi:MAG: hypothetical protein AAF317_08835 [Pseudomonadota bacterium]